MRTIVALALTALLLFGAGSTWIALFPNVPVDLGGVENLDRKAEKVRIPVGEGDALDAWFLPGSRKGLVIVFHGYARDHTRAWRYAQFLQRDGWAVLAPTFRSSRFWKRKPTTVGHHELADARAVIEWVRAQPRFEDFRVALLGESLGGAVALVLASERPDVAAVLADAPFASGRRAIEDAAWRRYRLPPWPVAPLARWVGSRITGRDPYGLDVVAACATLRERPVLLVSTRQDDRFGESHARDLWTALGQPANRLWVVDGGHNEAWLKHRDEYEKRARAFFRAPLGNPTLADRVESAASGVARGAGRLFKPSGER